MVFDTGASTVSLSHEMATAAGVKATDPSIDVTVRIANGDKVKARMVKLASVRIGKFEVKNVDCIVMPKDAPASPLLLGGSFLNNFKYEVDADAKKLRLVRIDGGDNKSPGK
jgi:aspartyl protease family protein